MANLIIDPHVLICPVGGDDEFAQYVDYLLKSWEMVELPWVTGAISEDTSELLARLNGYPDYLKVEEAARTSSYAEVVQPQDVIKITTKLIANSIVLEREALGGYLLLEDVRTEPSISGEEQPAPLVEVRERALATGVMYARKGDCTRASALATRLLPDGVDTLSFTCNVVACDSPAELDSPLPYALTSEFLVPRHSVHLSKLVDLAEEWTCSASDEERLGILDASVEAYEIDHHSPLEWDCSGDFLPSANGHGFLADRNKAERLLRACVETVLCTRLTDTHALRTGSGSSEPQIEWSEEGGQVWKAWRRDIDYEYHLHYWKSDGPDSEILFSRVVVHGDFDP